jgi:hypothetical protein
MKNLTIQPASKFGWHTVKGRGAYLLLNGVPGCYWSKEQGAMVAPSNALPLVGHHSEETETFVKDFDLGHQYQRTSASRLLHRRRLMLAYEMRCGKTLAALLALKENWEAYYGYQTKEEFEGLPQLRTLVVCPAMARLVWQSELKKWWPDHPTIELVRPLKLKKEKERGIVISPITITSYELLPKLPKTGWDNLIVDESQYVSHVGGTSTTRGIATVRGGAGRANNVRAISSKLPKHALFAMLSGTPIDTQVLDLWSQLDILYPGSMGTEWDFKARYMNEVPDKWTYSGVRYEGVNPAALPELTSRFQAVGDRVTKAEIEHLMPPMTVDVLRVKPKRLNIEEMLAFYQRRAEDPEASPFPTADRFKATQEYVKELRGSYGGPLMVLTYFRQSARDLASLLGTTHVVTGSESHQKRLDIVGKAASLGGIVVATMSSLLTALDLPMFSEVVYSELSHRPSDVSQSMNRYHSMNSQRDVHVAVIVLEGSPEEVIADTIAQRLSTVEKVVGSAATEKRLSEALAPSYSDDDFFSKFREIASDMEIVDGYT